MDLPILVSVVATIVVAGATVILALLTGRYVRLTGTMAAEMKRQREPLVFIDVEHRQRMQTLCVGNAGPTPALNVSFEVEEQVPWTTYGTPLKEIESLKRGITYLPPFRTLKFELGLVDWEAVNPSNSMARIWVRYRDESGRDYSSSIQINFADYFDVLYESFYDPVDHLTDAVRRLTPRKEEVKGASNEED